MGRRRAGRDRILLPTQPRLTSPSASRRSCALWAPTAVWSRKRRDLDSLCVGSASILHTVASALHPAIGATGGGPAEQKAHRRGCRDRQRAAAVSARGS